MEHSTFPGVRYLTLQDVLWINLQLLKVAQPFRFSALEEAVFSQYAYGESKNVPSQAARLLVSFNRLGPFDAGNAPTAFVATLAFLILNGKSISLPDSEGANWYGKAQSGAIQPEQAVEVAVGEGPQAADHSSVESVVQWVLARFPQTLEALAGTAAAAV